MATKLNKSTKTLQISPSSYRGLTSVEHETPFHVSGFVVSGCLSVHIKRKHLFRASKDNITMINLFNLI